jgi:hypothetical protein
VLLVPVSLFRRLFTKSGVGRRITRGLKWKDLCALIGLYFLDWKNRSRVAVGSASTDVPVLMDIDWNTRRL